MPPVPPGVIKIRADATGLCNQTNARLSIIVMFHFSSGEVNERPELQRHRGGVRLVLLQRPGATESHDR